MANDSASLPRSARDVAAAVGPATAWVIYGSGSIAAVDSAGRSEPWPLPAGLQAREVSVGPAGILWVLPTRGCLVLRRSPDSTGDALRVPDGVSTISAAADGTLWMIGARGEVLSLAAGGEIRRHSPPNFAEEISAGPDGSIWVISTTTRYGGRTVRRLDETGWFELPAPAAATKIAAAPDGMAWTVNSKGAVWRLHPLGGGNLAECQVDTACSECRFTAPTRVACDISVGADGSVWIVGHERMHSGAPALMRLIDPQRRAYRVVPTPAPPVRVAAAPGPAP